MTSGISGFIKTQLLSFVVGGAENSFIESFHLCQEIKLYFHFNGKQSERERETKSSSQDPSPFYMGKWSRMEDTLIITT